MIGRAVFEYLPEEVEMHAMRDALDALLQLGGPKGSKISISALAVPGSVEFRCRDQGRGIPPGFQSAIFERFQQVQASDTRRNVGTGPGLAVCKLIIEAHGGTIGVVSEEGVGITFWFRVPAGLPSS